MKKIAVMQPYIFPYIGYFQLMNEVDTFVAYDNIQFTKKGWIHRNRILVNGKDQYITIPLRKDSEYLNINERFLSDDIEKEKIKIINRIKGAYSKATYFKDVFPLIESILNYQDRNLFNFVFNSLKVFKSYLNINCNLIISSDLGFNIEEYLGQDKVIEICKHLDARTYINPIGGEELYTPEDFLEENIELKFLNPIPLNYKQFDNEFIPLLSIIDVMMFNSKEETINLLNHYEYK